MDDSPVRCGPTGRGRDRARVRAIDSEAGPGVGLNGPGSLLRARTSPRQERDHRLGTLEIVLQRLLPSVVLRGRRRRQTRARWNAGVDALHCLRCLHPVIRHLEHHILVLLALCTGCPTQALCGKIAVFFGRKECRTHDIPCATISRTCDENEDNGPDARVPKSVIYLKVDAEIPDAHSRKPLAEQI